MPEKLIHLPIEELARRSGGGAGEQYGPVFLGHLLEELDEELLDAMNYAGKKPHGGAYRWQE